MRVTVLYFAAMRDLAAREKEEIELPASVTSIGAFKRFIGERFHRAAADLASVRIAKNESFVDDGESVNNGDQLALIPPVAGG